MASFRSAARFDELQISAATRRALKEVFKYERLSAQQARYMPLMLRSDAPDVFVKAGTGSGKTLGFLIPAVEALVAARRSSSSRKAVAAIRVLILSPTRELAAQTASEAGRLLSFHSGMTAGVVTGGTDRSRDLRQMRTAPPDILVATPGRLQDLLEAEPRLLTRVKVVVLDEADRLLDPGFAPAVRKILATLPAASRARRRTLLLTATVPPEVQGVARQFMREGFEYVEASGAAGSRAAAGPANVGVVQHAVVCDPSDVHVQLARTLTQHHAAVGARAKVLVFFSSIALAEVYAALFGAHPQAAWAGLLELHGGLAQNKRTRAMDEFRARVGGVLFASDAAGRGIDIPLVTLVVQVGCAPGDVYQQRVGRTGRAGAKGEAVILLGTDEVRSLAAVKVVAPSIQVVTAAPVAAQEHLSFMIADRSRGLADRAFKGALGAYKANAKALGWKPQDVVDAVAARLLGIGMVDVPQVSDKTLAKMGLRGVSFDKAGILRRLHRSSRSAR